MKKNFTLILLMTVSTIYSQNRFVEQNIVSAFGGITGKKGFFVNVGYHKIIGFQGWSFRADAIYAKQNVLINNDIPLQPTIDMEHYMLLPSALYTIEQWGLDPFFINVYGGAMVGYEILNGGKKILSNTGLESETLKNSFVYGASLGTTVEYEISRSFSVSADGRQVFRMGSKAGQLTFYLGLGLLYYID